MSHISTQLLRSLNIEDGERVHCHGCGRFLSCGLPEDDQTVTLISYDVIVCRDCIKTSYDKHRGLEAGLWQAKVRNAGKR